VLFAGGPGGVGIATDRGGLDDRLEVPDRGLDTFGVDKGVSTENRDARVHGPQILGQDRVVGALGEPAIELGLGGFTAFDVAAAIFGVESIAQCRERLALHRRGVEREKFARESFQRHAHDIERLDVLLTQHGDQRPEIGSDLDQLLGLELPQRHADHGSRDARGFAHRALEQPSTGRQRPIQDVLADQSHDLLSQRRRRTGDNQALAHERRQ
jgi:hypothetical protein